MITEKELIEAIAECQGTRNPNANTCIKLASYYTILDHINNEEVEPYPTYSYASEKEESRTTEYYSETEFSQLVYNMDVHDVMEVMDELMTTLKVVNPRLYASVIRKLKGEG